MKIIKSKSRRDFLKLISLLSAGTTFSFKPGYQKLTDKSVAAKARDYFSLNKFYPSVNSLVIPEIAFHRGESFEAKYSLFSIGYDIFRREGNVSFSWKDQKDKKVCSCIVERYTETGNLKSIYHQISQHNNDKFFTPIQWTRHSGIAEKFNAPPFEYTELTGEVQIKENILSVTEKGQTFQKPLQGLPLLKWGNWGLFPCLNENTDFTFSWIDEMEQVFTGHRIKFRERLGLSIWNCDVTLCSFQQTGPGLIPTVYWLTENNVLLFVVSGTEIYMLDEFNGKQLNYNVPEGRIKRDIQ
jgi:hypothetical protein